MKITLEMYGDKVVAEISEDSPAWKIKDTFCRMLVVAGFSPSVLMEDEDGGRWEYVAEDEEVVKRKVED